LLTFLRICDFAIIDELELELGPGLIALTGETGAGKSIVVDALALASGGRAAADVVRHGSERAEVSATFDVRRNETALAWLAAHEIECDGECILRRIAGRDGRSRSFINGQVVPLQTLRELGELLVDIHGQHEFQTLVRRTAQRQLIDAHGQDEATVVNVCQAFSAWESLRTQRDVLQAQGRDRDARLELLRYQVRELEALALKVDEIPELLAEQRRLAHGSRLGEGARQALDLIYDDDSFSAHAAVGRAATQLRNLTALDAALAEPGKLLDEASIAIREAANGLRHYLEALDVDPQRRDWVERRMATIEELARKHRATAEELPQLFLRLQEELARLIAHESSLAEIEGKLVAAHGDYTRAASALSKSRQKAAKALTREVTRLLQTLGMPGGRFEAPLTTHVGREPSADGDDETEFLVTANPGQPLRPIARVASGGELSRISLAIQVAAAGRALTPCLVFDEVDAGIGGAVAEIVGRQLQALGTRAQVLCVTHLPQVASQADRHLRVNKLSDGRTTRTAIAELKGTERVEELARMLGGVEVSQKAREHAREMLKRAQQNTAASN
jgi:DNA repair protein RecN (Recombination protein N)